MTKVTYAGPCRRIDPIITAIFGIFKILIEFLTDFIVFGNLPNSCQMEEGMQSSARPNLQLFFDWEYY